MNENAGRAPETGWLPRSLRILQRPVFILDDPADIVEPTVGLEIEIVEVTRENVARIAEMRSASHVLRFGGFLDDGQVGVYAVHRGQVVGHGWAVVCSQPRCRVNGYIDIARGEALLHFCSVLREQRGKGVYKAMLVGLARLLFSRRAVRRVLVDADSYNIPSLRGIAATGFQPLGRGFYVLFRGRLIFRRFSPVR